MILKNWDVMRIYGVNAVTTDRVPDNEDAEICLRDYKGEIKNNDINVGDCINMKSWPKAYYSDAIRGQTYNDAWFMWPGGDIEEQPARIQQAINRNTVRYEDFNLYSPFYGTSSANPGTNTVYALSHVVSKPTYNKELDQWEKTVTREFKNESGKTITVRELGIYTYPGILVAREILDTPIIVEDDTFFKMSWTYKIDNPHEHKKVQRIRQYSFPDHQYFNNSPAKVTLNLQKKKVLLLRQYSVWNPQEIDRTKLVLYINKISGLNLSGWTQKNISNFSLYEKDVDSVDKQAIILVDLLTPDDTENNIITASGAGRVEIDNYSSSYGKYITAQYIYLEDTIQDIQRDFVLPFSGGDYDITVEKSENDNSTFWIACNSQGVGLRIGTHQKDYDFCDNLYYYNQNFATFLADNTNATSHIFKLPYHSGYEGRAIIKLKAIMQDNIPLYEDIPLKEVTLNV